MSELPISPGAEYIISRLESAGYQAYAVGGCVRDMLLGRAAGDWDITTSALPTQTKQVFSDLRTIDIGIRHGTVAVMYRGSLYEVTTYRVDGGYTDSRHPDSVTFTPSLAEDLARRDFTVNAMAYNPSRGLVDLYGGADDLSRSLLRTVGEPSLRFGEDALRIMRGVRFAAQLGFDIERDTASAMTSMAHTVTSVAAERIREEFSKLLVAPHASQVLCRYLTVVSAAVPFVTHAPDPHVLDTLPASLTVRLAYLLLDSPSPADSLAALRYDNALLRRVTSVVSTAPVLHILTDGELLRTFGEQGADVMNDAVHLSSALCPERASAYSRISAFLTEAAAAGTCTTVRDLAIDGSVLLSMGYRGKEVGQLLSALLVAVTDGTVPNTPDALTDLVRNIRL